MELQIITGIKELINPYTKREINVDEYISEINYLEDENKVLFTLNRLGKDDNINRNLEREIIKICKLDLDIKGVKISYNVETEEPQSMINISTKIVAILSGKGGVGKSNVTYNLAKELSTQGKRVGIIDADIYGYSIPKIAKAIEEPYIEGAKIKPVVDENGIEIISSQYFLPETNNKAIIWRGAKLNALLTHFVNDVMWSQDLDYIFIDMPPGTGDIILNINNLFDEIYALYVTTPSEDASYVAERIIQVGNELNFKNVGLVSNMAYYLVGDEKHFIFGEEGAKKLANDYKLDLLAEIPIGTDADKYYDELAKNVIKTVI